MKFNNIILLIISILLIIFIIYIFSNKKIEAFTLPQKLESLPQSIITLHTNTKMKRIILTGYEYLHLSEFRLFDPYGFEYITNVDYKIETNSPRTKGSTWDLDKLTDNDPYTFFQTDSNTGPNGQPVALTVTFNDNDGVFIGSVLIRNRYDCCWHRINKFTMNMYDVKGGILAEKSLTDASLTNYQTGGWDYNITDITIIAKIKDDLLQNHMNDNVILCTIARPELNLCLHSNELVKKLTISGNNWLHFSELGLYDTYENKYKYLEDFTVSINTEPMFLNNSPSYDFTNLFDDDPVSYFHSGQNTNVIFTVLFNNTNGVNLGKILIRNRYNLNHSFIHSFDMKLYDSTNKLLSKPCQLNEPSLSNWRDINTVDINTDGAGERSSSIYKSAVNNIKTNHINDNVISYVLYRPQSKIPLYFDTPVKKIIFKGAGWLQIAELNMRDMEGNPLAYNKDFTVSINTTPQTWDNNNLAFDFSKMFDNDPTTSCYSGASFGPNEKPVELTILFNNANGINLQTISIKNRMNCCWRRINAFTMNIYDTVNNILASQPLTHPYLTNYPQFNGLDDFKQNHLTDNLITYVLVKPYKNINARSIAVGYNSVGITSNSDIYTYTMSNIENSKLHTLVIPNYNFVVGDTFLITFSCYTNSDGVLNKMNFGYQSKSGQTYYTSPALTTELQTYVSTVTIMENGLLYIYVNANANANASQTIGPPISATTVSPTATTSPSPTTNPSYNNVLYFKDFSIELKQSIITMQSNSPDYTGYNKSINNIVYGSDIINYSNYTYDQCKRSCDNMPDCAGFVKSINNIYDNGCWLKSNINKKPVNDNNLVLYEKQIITATPIPTIPSPTIYVSSSFGLSNYGLSNPSINSSTTTPTTR